MNNFFSNKLIDKRRIIANRILLAQAPLILIITFYLLGITWTVHRVVIGLLAFMAYFVYLRVRNLQKDIQQVNNELIKGFFEKARESGKRCQFTSWEELRISFRKMDLYQILFAIVLALMLSRRIIFFHYSADLIPIVFVVSAITVTFIFFYSAKKYIVALIQCIPDDALSRKGADDSALPEEPLSFRRLIIESCLSALACAAAVLYLFQPLTVTVLQYAIAFFGVYASIRYAFQLERFFFATVILLDRLHFLFMHHENESNSNT